jgi:hypothetical protein
VASLIVTPTGWESFRLSRKAALACEVLGDYVRMRILMRRGTLEETVSRLREPVQRAASPSVGHGENLTVTGIRLGRVVVQTLAPLPTDSRCLMRSLVLLRMMARRGATCRLVIGVSPEPEFKAHAWLERAGQPLFATGGDAYARLLEL